MTQYQIQTKDGPRTFCFECGASWLTDERPPLEKGASVQCLKCGEFPKRQICPEHLMGCPPFEPFAEGETAPQLDALVRYIGQWADWQFARDGKFRGLSIVAHMHREVDELELALTVPEMFDSGKLRRKVLDEIADIMIMSAHLLHQLKATPSDAVLSKMRRVTVREWGEPDDEGVIEHVRECRQCGEALGKGEDPGDGRCYECHSGGGLGTDGPTDGGDS